MRQFMMAVMAVAPFGAMVATAQAENQTPNPRTVSGPVHKRTVSQTARPSQQALSAATVWCFPGGRRCSNDWHDCAMSHGWGSVNSPPVPCLTLREVIAQSRR